MPFTIIRDDITHVKADAIVNAANSDLMRGGGVCGAIFKAAGSQKLQAACDKIGYCSTGNAVATPAFNLHARYVIHAVGPIWSGGSHGEREKLASCYRRSLELADSLGCESIAFPLISAGIYGYPRRLALEVAREQIQRFLDDHEMDVSLVLFDKGAVELADDLSLRVQRFIDDVYVDTSGYNRRRIWENSPISQLVPDEAESIGSAEDLVAASAAPLGADMMGAPEAAAEGSAPSSGPLTCPRCGATVAEGAIFCINCGVRLSDQDAATQEYSPEYFLPNPVLYDAAPSAPSAPAQAPAAAPAPKTHGAQPLENRRRLKLPLSLRNRLKHMDAGFSETLLALIDDRGMNDVQVYKRANLSRQHFSKIRSNPRYKPSKQTVLALAVALELPFEDTVMLLERAGFALSHADRRDVIVEFFIREGVYDVFEINEALFAFDQPLLG